MSKLHHFQNHMNAGISHQSFTHFPLCFPMETYAKRPGFHIQALPISPFVFQWKYMNVNNMHYELCYYGVHLAKNIIKLPHKCNYKNGNMPQKGVNI